MKTQICQMKGCTYRGVYAPILNAPPPKEYASNAFLVMEIKIAVCAWHKSGSKVSDFIGDEGRAQINAAVKEAGRVQPDWDRATLRWKQWTGEWEALPDDAEDIRETRTMPPSAKPRTDS